MAVAYVTSAASTYGVLGASPQTATRAISGLATGDLIVVYCLAQSSATRPTLTIAGGGLTWTQFQTGAGGTQTTVTAWWAIATSSTSFTATVTITEASTTIIGAVVGFIGFSGNDPTTPLIDSTLQTSSSSATPTINVTTTAPNCLVAGVADIATGTAVTLTAGTGYNSAFSGTTSSLIAEVRGEYASAITASAGTVAVNFAATIASTPTIIAWAVQPPVTTNVNLTDSGHGSETATITANLGALTDSAHGSDATEITAKLSLADSAHGSDATGITARIPIADTGHGSDGLTLAVSLPLTDSAHGSDAVSITNRITLGDTATGSDSVTVFSNNLVYVADFATGSESISIVKSGGGGPVPPFVTIGRHITKFRR